MNEPRTLYKGIDIIYREGEDRWIFTLVGRDPTSPRTVAFWILENIETAPREKLEEALRKALIMRDTSPRRVAD